MTNQQFLAAQARLNDVRNLYARVKETQEACLSFYNQIKEMEVPNYFAGLTVTVASLKQAALEGASKVCKEHVDEYQKQIDAITLKDLYET